MSLLAKSFTVLQKFQKIIPFCNSSTERNPSNIIYFEVKLSTFIFYYSHVIVYALL